MLVTAITFAQVIKSCSILIKMQYVLLHFDQNRAKGIGSFIVS